ncbi:MAG: hypothetical protein HXY40_12235 [Chloroflexi bacterium]|nr:hypothetical protein [Chloroflexota bacterium]
MQFVRCIVLLCILISAGCFTADAPPNAPTQVLIPAPPTFTPAPLLPTPTVPTQPAPADVVTPDMAFTPLPENLQALAQQISADLATALRIPASGIQVVRVEPAFWMTADLGCALESAAGQRTQGYRFILLAADQFYEYHSDSGTQFLRCAEIDPTAAATLAIGTLLQIDPIAAELVALAQRRLAQELDLPLRRIQLVDLRLVRWTDSSLGCPQPEQTYTPMQIDGYRIVLSVGERQYVFHTDFDRLIPCDAQDEQLPAP